MRGPTDPTLSDSGTASTFLFVDLVGFTTLTAERGDEEAADAALALYASVRPLLAAHGAEEIKTIGDAMMLRCGQAAAGVALGLHIVRSVEAHDRLPAVRVGVHTGPAVQRDGDWYGTTVNVAARLCSAAGSGQLLAADSTLAAAGRVEGAEIGEQRLHWLKNVTTPVSARVVSLREPTAATSPLPASPGPLAGAGWTTAVGWSTAVAARARAAGRRQAIPRAWPSCRSSATTSASIGLP